MESAEHYILPLPKLNPIPKILIIRAPYYKEIADDLLKGCTEMLEDAGIEWECIDVPGALEIPPAIRILCQQSDIRFDGYVALGCVIRGETTHYETVCNESARALMTLGLEGIAIGNGILTLETLEQARERAAPDKQNKGAAAGAAALHLIALKSRSGL